MSFFFFGDMGSGESAQIKVAQAMKDNINNKTMFICGLGDNIYEDGCSSVDDPLFETHFERPYSIISDKIPFYMCLGNHDYGYSDIPLNRKKNAGYQVLYSKKSKKWKMPYNYYTFTKKMKGVTVQIFVMDTNLDEQTDEEIKKQFDYMKNEIKKSKADWKIVNGHHTWRSIAGHGNAEEKLEELLMRLVNESPFDVYMCGHDHNKQVIELITNGKRVNLVVCGAGGKIYHDGLNNYDNLDDNSDLKFCSNNLGYGICYPSKNKLQLKFHNELNELEYQCYFVK
jgi:tartrate-resistant acid phosphatase type 5